MPIISYCVKLLIQKIRRMSSPLAALRDPKTVCIVKIIQNSRLPESFSMKMILYPQKKVEVTINTPTRIQLMSIVQEMKKVYGAAKFAFKVQFNWTNVAKEIRNDAYLKAEIYNIFQNAPAIKSFVTEHQYHESQTLINELDQDSIAAYVDLVRTHVVDYGAAPDFKVRTEKNKKRVCNYIRSTCAMPQLSEATVLLIADSL
jgi:hypothetical protein